jgi:hypothetical protein
VHEVADDDLAHDRLVVDDEYGCHRRIVRRLRLRRDEQADVQAGVTLAQGLPRTVDPSIRRRRDPMKRPMKRPVKRIVLLGLGVVLAAAALSLPALAADGPVKTYAQDVTLGFYRGQVVSYLDFGPVKLRPGNKTAPIWAFTNGDPGQRNIIDTVPGRRDYTPLWAVRMITWNDGARVRVLRSAAAVARAQRAGELTIRAMPIVVNCPVL